MATWIWFAVVCLPMLPLSKALHVNTTAALCSRTCESKHCDDPVRLRYGKYCGVGYSACDGELPCDGLDSCCQAHDACVGWDLENYVNTTCSNNLLDCVERWETSNAAQFTGNTCDRAEVTDTITDVMKLITLDGQLGNSAITTLSFISSVPILTTVLFINFYLYQ